MILRIAFRFNLLFCKIMQSHALSMDAMPGNQVTATDKTEYGIALIADIRVSYYRNIVESIIAHSHNMERVRVRIVEANVDSMFNYPDRPKLHGVITQPLRAEDYQRLKELGCAILNFSSRSDIKAFPDYVAHVVTDDFAVGQMAARHFHGMGLRNFGFYGSHDLEYSHRRLAGFQDYLRKLPRRDVPEVIVRMDFSQRPEQWVAGLPLPIGVFATNDNHARSVISAAVACKLRVPEDVAVIGVDADKILSELSPLRITSIQPDAGSLAKTALGRLVELIEGRCHPREVYGKIPPRGVHYTESAPLYHAADPIVARALIWLERNLAQWVSIDELARVVGLSRRALEYRFRSQLNCAPYQKLLEMRLRKARELMLQTNQTINSIALETGFTNQREFCVRFKQKEGCTPTEFRSTLS